MTKIEQANSLLERLRTQYVPHLSVDCVIFGFHGGQLKVLSLAFLDTDLYVLPGGYVNQEEGVDEAAVRILQERSGLEHIYLEQFYTFGDAQRAQEPRFREGLERAMGQVLSPNDWWLKRVISVGYFALVDYTKIQPARDHFSNRFEWFDVTRLPEYLFDHRQIVQKALTALQHSLDRKLIGFNLLEETFTMADLQQLYEAVYQSSFTRTNFQRKMLSLGVLERLEKKYTGGAHKAPYLYRFKR